MSDYEPILDAKKSRFTVFPIEYNTIWDLYESQMSCMWKAKEVDYSKDYDDFLTLNKDEQHFIKMVLAFFAASDGIINWNLSERFLSDVQIMEAKVAYTFQMAMENIHGEAYSLQLDNIVRNKEEKQLLFNSIEKIPSVKLMSEWAFKWIKSDKSFQHRVIAFAIIEGVFFSGAFAAIFWLKKYRSNGQQFMNGLIKSNEFIARDEGLHTEFACEIYRLLNHKLTFNEVKEIFNEGVNISKTFMNDALPCRLLGMDSVKMNAYIEYVSDRLLVSLGYQKLYNTTNPFEFMNSIGLSVKNNFFESRSTEYQSATVLNENTNIEINEDF